MKAEKKTRTSRVKGAVVAGNGATTETMLPEQTDAGREIALATETPGVPDGCSVSFLTNPTRPSDPVNHDSKPSDGDKSEPAKKPAMLTDEAEKVRKSFLSNAFDSIKAIESGKFDAEAMKTARKHLRQVKLVAVFPVIEAAFAGRPENSVDADELRTHIETVLAALPAEAGDDKFEKDANKFVGSRSEDVQRMLHDLFNGRYNVGIDEVLVKEAEINLGRDPRKFYGLKFDGEPMNCNFRLNIGKPDERECAIRFIPLAWRDHGVWTGHFLIRQTNDGNQKIAFCGRHAGGARKDGAQMLSNRDADRALGVFKHNEEERKATRANLGSIANVSVKDGRIVTGNSHSRQQADDRPTNVTDEEKRAASKDVNVFIDRVPGPYFFKHPTWEVKDNAGYVIRKGAKVFVVSDGTEATILDKENDFGKMLNQPFRLDDIPKKFWAFLAQYRNITRD